MIFVARRQTTERGVYRVLRRKPARALVDEVGVTASEPTQQIPDPSFESLRVGEEQFRRAFVHKPQPRIVANQRNVDVVFQNHPFDGCQNLGPICSAQHTGSRPPVP